MWRRIEKIVKNLQPISLGLFMNFFDFRQEDMMTRKKRHKNIITKNSVILLFCLLKKTMKLKFLIFNFSFLILTSCASNRPVATTHTECIEERVMPIPVGADTIEIKLNVGTRHAVSDDPKGQNRHNIQPIGRTDTACRVPTIESVRSTRALSMTKITTDTTSMLRITLRPDTVFVPYTNHIRSDTIVVPDRICNEKLKQTKFMNVILLIFLILFVATIIYRKIFHK
jgi:hypothetical protein